MGKFKTIIGERVKGKIENLRDYFAKQESGQDTEFLAGLWDCLESLEENPQRWQYLNTRKEGIRRASFAIPKSLFTTK